MISKINLPEGVSYSYNGRGYSYVKDLQNKGGYPNFEGYNGIYLEMYGFENNGYYRDFFKNSSIGYLPKISFPRKDDGYIDFEYAFDGCEFSYISPFIDWGTTPINGNYDHLNLGVYQGNLNFFISNNGLKLDGYLFNYNYLPYYIGKIQAGKNTEHFFIENMYGEDEEVFYIGGFDGFKGSMAGGYSNPSINSFAALTPKSYVDFFNSLYDFRANGETPSGDNGKIKLNPRAFEILTPDELAILTNKGWTILQ